MAGQGGNRSGGDGERSRFGDPLSTGSIIEAEESRLGITDENPGLTDEQKAERQRTDFFSRAPLLGQEVAEARDVEWIIQGLFARGGVYLLGGNPKKARKSFLCMDMALAIARGSAFLGLPTTQHPVIYANFEDGRARTARRLRDFGAVVGATDDVRIVSDRRAFASLLTHIKWQRPPVVIIDPVIEVELLMGVRDENRSDQIARMLGDLRDLVRDANTGLFMPHHLARNTQELRGSTAFAGSTDGWVMIRSAINKANGDSPNRAQEFVLESTNRDCPDMSIPFKFEDKTATNPFTRVVATGTPEIGPLPEFSMKKRAAPKEAKPAGQTDDGAKNALLIALLNAPDGLAASAVRSAAGVRNDRVIKIRSELMQDGLVAEKKSGKATVVVLTPKGRQEALRAVAGRAPKGVDDLIGGNTDDDV